MLTKEQEVLIKIAKGNKQAEKHIKAQVARRFHISAEKINLQKAFEYINYLDSPTGKLEQFLDRVTERL